MFIEDQRVLLYYDRGLRRLLLPIYIFIEDFAHHGNMFCFFAEKYCLFHNIFEDMLAYVFGTIIEAMCSTIISSVDLLLLDQGSPNIVHSFPRVRNKIH